MADETTAKSQAQIIDELQVNNKQLIAKNEELENGLKDLKLKFNSFLSSSTQVIPKTDIVKIPDEEFNLDVDGQTVKIKFIVPRFRIDNQKELTALEASTDPEIMESLIRNHSGVIRVLE